MKKVLFLVVSLATLTASAQMEKGNMIVGTSTNLTYSSTSTVDCDNCDAVGVFDLGLSYGYFVIDNLALNAGVNLSSSSSGGSSTSTTSIGLSARYYMNSIFAQAGYNTVSIKDVDGSSNSLGFGAGSSHMLSDNIALEPMLMYQMDSYDGNATSNTLMFRIGLGLYL